MKARGNIMQKIKQILISLNSLASKLQLVNYQDKVDELSKTIYEFIEGKEVIIASPGPMSLSNDPHPTINENIGTINKVDIRDILFTLGIKGQIASFSHYAEEEIKKHYAT